jgi:hypothetical protein
MTQGDCPVKVQRGQEREGWKELSHILTRMEMTEIKKVKSSKDRKVIEEESTRGRKSEKNNNENGGSGQIYIGEDSFC